MSTITPRTLKGFRDFLPAAMRHRQKIIRTVMEVYETFGFLPLETPALEYADVLTGKYGAEGEKLMYRFRDQGDRDVALRYDLTVPLARVVAQYPDLPQPFRRYQIAPVWRAENPQKGRFREFVQCDFDIVGTKSVLADAEVGFVIATVLQKLAVGKYQVQFNNRKILNGLLEAAGVRKEQWTKVIRVLDKWKRVEANVLRTEAEEILGKTLTQKVWRLLPEDSKMSEWLLRVSKDLQKTQDGPSGIDEVNQLRKLFNGKTFSNSLFIFDPLLARGLDYYTGTIYEAVLTDRPEFGSIFGGGRYDTLIGQFTGHEIPAVGASIGVDRLLAALEQGSGFEQAGQLATADVLVLMVEKALSKETFTLALELRNGGVAVELYADPVKLEKQLKYANRLGFRYAVLLGSEEMDSHDVTVKDLQQKKQERVLRHNLTSWLRQHID